MPDKQRILIVDDTPENVQILGNLLKQRYDLGVAMSGMDALKTLETKPYDLILLDVMMPGMDGFEVSQRIREMDLPKQPPIIHITAKNDKDSVVKGLQGGAQDYIVKPFDKDLVLSRVKEHLEAPTETVSATERRSPDHGGVIDVLASAPIDSLREYLALELSCIRSGILPQPEMKTELDQLHEHLRDILVKSLATSKAILSQADLAGGTYSAMLVEIERDLRALEHEDSPLRRLGHYLEQESSISERLEAVEQSLTSFSEREDEQFLLGRRLERNVSRLPKSPLFHVSSELMDTEMVRGDARYADMIFYQLLANSIEAPGIGQEPRLVMIATKDLGDSVEWIWADNGLGPDRPDKIGMPFVTGKNGHAGVGLALVRGVVEERLRGNIDFRTNGPNGLEIRLELPCS